MIEWNSYNIQGWINHIARGTSRNLDRSDMRLVFALLSVTVIRTFSIIGNAGNVGIKHNSRMKTVPFVAKKFVGTENPRKKAVCSFW